MLLSFGTDLCSVIMNRVTSNLGSLLLCFFLLTSIEVNFFVILVISIIQIQNVQLGRFEKFVENVQLKKLYTREGGGGVISMQLYVLVRLNTNLYVNIYNPYIMVQCEQPQPLPEHEPCPHQNRGEKSLMLGSLWNVKKNLKVAAINLFWRIWIFWQWKIVILNDNFIFFFFPVLFWLIFKQTRTYEFDI